MSVASMTTPRGFFPAEEVLRVIDVRRIVRIAQLDPDDGLGTPGASGAVGALMVGRPWASRLTRRRRMVAATATNPSARTAACLNSEREWVRVEQHHAHLLEVAPSFMLTVLISTSYVVWIVDTQLGTLTLKRKGPFGEEQVPTTYARLPRITTLSQQIRERLCRVVEPARRAFAPEVCPVRRKGRGDIEGAQGDDLDQADPDAVKHRYPPDTAIVRALGSVSGHVSPSCGD